MARDAAAAGGGEMVAERRPSFVQDCKEAGFVNACERQWHRTVAHAKAFPYLWASFFLIYGTCRNRLLLLLLAVILFFLCHCEGIRQGQNLPGT
jgi:hypothetical protein